MKRLVFGSQEANAQLRRDGGMDYDQRDVNPFAIQTHVAPEIEDEKYCDVCGGYMDWVDCWQCGGKGGRDGDDLIQEDPMWYDEDDWETCDVCRGAGGHWECASLPHSEKKGEECKDA